MATSNSLRTTSTVGSPIWKEPANLGRMNMATASVSVMDRIALHGARRISEIKESYDKGGIDKLTEKSECVGRIKATYIRY